MSIFCFIQNRLLQRLTVDRERNYCPLAQVGSVLFVFDGGTPDCEEAIRNLCKTLDRYDLQYEGICLDLHRKQPTGAWVNTLPHVRVIKRKQLTLLGSPFRKKHPQIKALADQEFGLFLNLTLQTSYAEACLATASRARLKVGLKDAQNKTLQQTYDICFSYHPTENDPSKSDSESKFPEWTQKLIQYLTHIKSTL